MIGAKLFAETVKIGAHFWSTTCPGFGEDGYFAAIDVPESFGDMGVTAVRVGGVEKTQTIVVAVEQKTREAVNAEGSLMRVMSDADCASAHGQARGLNAGAAQGDSIVSRKFA